MTDASSNRVRVLLADAHGATRAGLRMALAGEAVEIVAEVDSAGTAVDAADRERPDVCVLDADMPGGAVRATTEILRAHPQAAGVLIGPAPPHETLLGAGHGGV